ncbi:hypothetical protein ACK8P5_04545 [Paenibacillus sp. EC2-1]
MGSKQFKGKSLIREEGNKSLDVLLYMTDKKKLDKAIKLHENGEFTVT